MIMNKPTPLTYRQIQAHIKDVTPTIKSNLENNNFFEALAHATAIRDMLRCCFAAERRVFGVSWARSAYNDKLLYWNRICRLIERAGKLKK